MTYNFHIYFRIPVRGTGIPLQGWDSPAFVQNIFAWVWSPDRVARGVPPGWYPGGTTGAEAVCLAAEDAKFLGLQPHSTGPRRRVISDRCAVNPKHHYRGTT